MLALAALIGLLLPNVTFSNEIYVNQIGNDVDLTITQDGENNKIGALGNLSSKGLLGSYGPSTFSYTQTGNNNTLGFYNADIGDSNSTLTQTGDNNMLDSYQTDTNRASGGTGHHIANVVNGDNNGVTHTQKGKAGHDGFIEIQGDNNDVDLYQRGNGGQHWTDIVLTGDDHTVDATQRGTMAHSFEVDLTNSGGAYSVNSNQTTNNTTTSKSYSLTGICTNTAGCSISVSQN